MNKRQEIMGLIMNIVIIGALASFVVYNMDSVNKLASDVRYIKNRMDELKPLLEQNRVLK